MKILGNLFKILFVLLFGGIVIAAIWLKTNHANQLIRQAVINGAQEHLAMSVKIDNMQISLPLIVDIDSFEVSDQMGKIGSIRDLHINILPSLDSFWKVTFWSISADELLIDRIPNIVADDNKESPKGKGIFNPDISIREISIDNIKLSPQVTGLKDSFSIKLNSYLEYSNSRENLSLNT